MRPSILFIVSGPPSSGKTTLAKAVATKFNLPLITKDSLKEILFDTIGWQDRAWSRRLGSASFSLLHYILDAFVQFAKYLQECYNLYLFYNFLF